MLYLELVLLVASLNFKAAINHCSKNNLWPKLGLLKNGLDLNKFAYIPLSLFYCCMRFP